MTPFETDDGWIVYVNRGFVPRDREDPATRRGGPDRRARPTVTGLLRAAEPAGHGSSPADDPAGNAVVLARSRRLFAAASGLPAGDGRALHHRCRASIPTCRAACRRAARRIVAFPNNHLQYALTWFGLAAALVAVFVAFVVRSGAADAGRTSAGAAQAWPASLDRRAGVDADRGQRAVVFLRRGRGRRSAPASAGQFSQPLAWISDLELARRPAGIAERQHRACAGRCRARSP